MKLYARENIHVLKGHFFEDDLSKTIDELSMHKRSLDFRVIGKKSNRKSDFYIKDNYNYLQVISLHPTWHNHDFCMYNNSKHIYFQCNNRIFTIIYKDFSNLEFVNVMRDIRACEIFLLRRANPKYKNIIRYLMLALVRCVKNTIS